MAAKERRTIALVPIGQVDESILTIIGEAVGQTFGRAWVIADPLPHPGYAFDSRRRQYRSEIILGRLRRLSLPAERWLGVVDLDLYTPGLNFVFGQANVGGPAAVVSLARLRQGFYGLPEDETLFQERAIKEAVHELGHTYGLGHCSDPRCVMSFSNSLLDVDRKSADLCPRCRRRLPTVK